MIPTQLLPSHLPNGRTVRAGFSMVELLVVIAIIGLSTMVVTLSVESLLPGERLNTSVRALATRIREARSEAFSRNLEFSLEYDITNNRYRLVTPFLEGGEGQMFLPGVHHEDERYLSSWESPRDGVALLSVEIAGVQYTKGNVFVIFDSSGGASDHRIVLTQPEYETRFTVEVAALTGMIHFHDGEYLREIPEDADFD